MLGRYWKAFTDKPPPQELRALLERFSRARGSTSMSVNNKLPRNRVVIPLTGRPSTKRSHTSSNSGKNNP